MTQIFISNQTSDWNSIKFEIKKDFKEKIKKFYKCFIFR